MRLGKRLCVGLFASATVVPAQCATTDDVPPPMQQAVDCILGVLHQTPGVEDAKFNVERDGSWVHRHLVYQYADKRGRKVLFSIGFEARRVSGRDVYLLHAGLPGLTAPGSMPEDWGTTELAKRLDTQCAVHMDVLYN